MNAYQLRIIKIPHTGLMFMSMVELALRRPYTFIVMALLIVLATPLALMKMATDIFPEINIPVISIIWNYNGLSAQEMGQRIASQNERGLTTVVSDIEHIESQSLAGVAVIKVFFQPNANIQKRHRAGSGFGAIAIAPTAAGDHAAAGDQIFGIEHSGHATGIVQPDLVGTILVRCRCQYLAAATDHHSRRRRALSLRRQEPGDFG